MPKIYKKIFSPLSLSMIILASVLSGCAGKDAAPTFTPDPKAFDFALSQAIQANIYIEKCQKVDGSLIALAEEAKTYWKQANQKQVLVADAHFSERLKNQTFTYQGSATALPAVSLLTSFEQKISAQLNGKRQSFSSLIAQCKFQLTNIKTGKFDIATDANANNYLLSLPANSANNPFNVPSLAGVIRNHKTPGTTHYTVGQMLSAAKCLQEEIITLEKSDVIEEYAATCSNGKAILIHCNLGQCEASYLN